MAGEEQKDVAAGAPSDDTPGLVAGKVVPRHGAYEARRSSTVLATVISVAVLFALFVVSLGLGRAMIPPAEVLGILGQQFFGMQGDFSQGNVTIVINVRLPRICAAMLVGSALAIAGATYQGLFKNPMVSPDILGASAGASFGAALALLLTNGGGGIVETSAFVLGFVAVMLTYFSSKSIGHGTNMTLLLVLCGLIVGTLFQSFVSIIKYTADPDSKLPEITYWLMGSLANVNKNDVLFLIVPLLIGVVPTFLLRWRLNVMVFGDEEAQSLGLNVKRIRGGLILCATLLTATSVAVAGMIGWIGLIIPHMCRFIVGPNYKNLVPMSLLVGGIFLLVVDCLARTLFTAEIPLGILTSLIGAPFFVYLLFKRKKESA